MFWLQYLRPGQTWSDTDLAKRRILCQIPSHVITTSRSPPLPSLENHLNFPEPNAPYRRFTYSYSTKGWWNHFGWVGLGIGMSR